MLTEPDYFGGELRFIAEAKQSVTLPVLRKDFIVDPLQIYESRAAEADAVLLIAAALSDDTLEECMAACKELGMSAFVETHDEAEIDRALALGAEIVGVNQRNLHTFDIDHALCQRLRPKVPSYVTFVAESGISHPSQVMALKAIGVDAVLIGTAIMKQQDRIKATSAFVSGGQ